jgi:hypothetical protein
MLARGILGGEAALATDGTMAFTLTLFISMLGSFRTVRERLMS